MPNLNDQQLAQLAYDAGFRGDSLRWAVAVAKAESGGNPSAYNPEIAAGTVPGSGSRGLWQIYGTAHPQYNSSLAFDPVVNARAAYQVWREAGGKFTPWSTYTNGSAAQYYQTIKIAQPAKSSGMQPSAQVPSNNTMHAQPQRTGLPGSGSPDQGNPLLAQVAQTNQSLADIASGKFIMNIFAGVDKPSLGFFLAGLALIVIGLVVLFAKPAARVAIAGAKLANEAGAISIL